MIIISEKGRLCRDTYWRNHAPFGSQSNCVKVYRSKGAAINRARKLYKTNGVKIVKIPDNIEIDASGRCIERKSINDTHEEIIPHDINEFAIWTPEGEQ